METSTKVYGGIIGVLSILALFGGSLYLTQDEFDHAYVCSTTDKLGLFDRVSSTAKTGYYTDASGVIRSNLCSGGTWVKLSQYAKNHNIDPLQFIATQSNPENIVVNEVESPKVSTNCQGSIKAYECGPKSCVAICG